MKFWKVCLVGAVLALTASADDHEDDVGAPDSNDTLDGDGEVIIDDSDLLDDDLEDDIDELLDEIDDLSALDLELTDKELPLFEAEVEEAKVYNDMCFRCIYEGYSFCSSDGRTGTCQPAFCANDDPREDN